MNTNDTTLTYTHVNGSRASGFYVNADRASEKAAQQNAKVAAMGLKTRYEIADIDGNTLTEDQRKNIILL